MDGSLGGLSIIAARNSYGRQIQSSEQTLLINLGKGKDVEFPGIFIRAPKIIKVLDKKEVKILAVNAKNDGIVGVRQGNIMATSFHPELTQDLRFHQYFLDIIIEK